MTDNAFTAQTAEADRYLALADSLKYGDPARILSAAEMAAVHAQALGDFRRYARALVHQAWAYGFFNQYEASLSHALQALILARDYRLIEIEALAVGVIAFNFLKCGILAEAAYLFEHQQRLGEQINDQALQAMALNDLAVVKMETAEFETSATLLHQAVRLMPADTHEGMDKSIAHLNLAFACVKTGQFDEVTYHAGYVLEHVPEKTRFASDAHLWIAASHLARGELNEADKRIRQARACIEQADPPIYNANIDQLTAELVMAQGQHQDAIRIWETVYQRSADRHELDTAISALHSLKAVYEQLGDSTGLISVYKRLSEDIPARQQQSSDLRFTVLRMIFTTDKAALDAELRLSQQKSAILNRLSHEFRTPLAVIQSSVELLERYAERLTLGQRREYLARIGHQVKWMTVMLDDILEIIRLDDSGSSHFLPVVFRLGELVQAALDQITNYHISVDAVRVELQQGDHVIQGAQRAFQTILVQLLTNAIKYSTSEVRLALSIHENTLTMQVTDHGIGIPFAEQQDIFKPLVRGTNLDEVTGSGLGLTIVARLVSQLNGRIALESVVNQGTSVTVHIPLP